MESFGTKICLFTIKLKRNLLLLRLCVDVDAGVKAEKMHLYILYIQMCVKQQIIEEIMIRLSLHVFFFPCRYITDKTHSVLIPLL